MTTLFAVDDGIWSGNYDLADIFFLIAVILFALEVVIRLIPVRETPHPATRFGGVLLAGGLFCVAFGWLVL